MGFFWLLEKAFGVNKKNIVSFVLITKIRSFFENQSSFFQNE